MSAKPEYLCITISVPPGFAKARHDLPECWADMDESERERWIYDKAHQDMTDAEHSIGWRSSLHYHDGTEVGGDGASDDSVEEGIEEAVLVRQWMDGKCVRPTVEQVATAFRGMFRAWARLSGASPMRLCLAGWVRSLGDYMHEASRND